MKYNYNNKTIEHKKDDSLLEINNNSSNNNNKIFSLYQNFLIKEKNSNKKTNNEKLREILPKYYNIETQINTKNNTIKNFYKLIPIFNDSIEQNSSFTLFKKGFKNLFFGPDGIITRKSINLKKFYKSLNTKKIINLNEKLYLGSMDFFDKLGNYNTYNERLKHNQRRRLIINGNFDMTNPALFKMRSAYKNFTKRISKNIIFNKDIKNNNLYENINTEASKINRSNRLHKTYNLFLDYKNNLIPTNNNLKHYLFKQKKATNQDSDMIKKNEKNSMNISDIINNTQNNIFNTPNLKPISNKKNNLFLKTCRNSPEEIKKQINNLKNNIAQTENKEKKVIENYTSKTSKFIAYFKQKKDFKKYINSYNKTLKGKIYSSNNSNNKIRDSLNNFIIKNEKYEKRKNKFFKKKMEEPYNEFKEDSKNEEIFNNFAKNVDFSNTKSLNIKNNINDNINNMNMVSFKIGLGRNIPIKEYIKKMKKKKEKEKEYKILNSVRLNFKKNSKIIHNLTISLDDIKKKYNY